jgi:hypothetical protein
MAPDAVRMQAEPSPERADAQRPLLLEQPYEPEPERVREGAVPERVDAGGFVDAADVTQKCV